MAPTTPPMPNGAERPSRDIALSALCLLALAWVLGRVFAPSIPPQPADPNARRIGYLQSGVNEVRRRGHGMLVWHAVSPNEMLFERDAIFVGTASAAEVCFENGSCIDIDESSLVIVEPVSEAPVPTVAAEIRRGGLSGDAGDGQMAIKTLGALTALPSGSRANVRVSKGHEARIDVLAGTAQVTTLPGETIQVNNGQRSTVAADGYAEPVRKLRVDLVAPPHGDRNFIPGPRRSISFRWRPPSDATSCELEVSRDAAFSDVVVRETTTQHTAVAPDLRAGAYYWRVSCDTEREKELSPELRFTLVHDQAPVLLRPGDKEVVVRPDGRELVLAWSRISGATGYAAELSRREDPDTPLVSARSDRAWYVVPQVRDEGYYCFRVRVVAKRRPAPPWSARRCFRLVTRPVLGAPRVYDAGESVGARKGSQEAKKARER